jgi:short-subunit dehydrogenase
METIMFAYKSQTALITGASSGIGAAFAEALAARGMHLVLVARSKDKLEGLGTELAKTYGVGVQVIAMDLSKPGASRRVFEQTTWNGLTVDLLVNNAGFATHGLFEELPLERQYEEIMLNCTAVVEMTHWFLPGMVSRGSGGVVNVASTAAFQPLPYMAVYGATKAFVLSFSEALWAENRARGVRVLALCPGATDTPFFDVVAAPEASVGGARQDPEDVVARALKALESGRMHLISGTKNYLMANVSRFFPRRTVAAMTARVLRPKGTVYQGTPSRGNPCH